MQDYVLECPNCSEINPLAAKFCGSCQTQLSRFPTESESKGKKVWGWLKSNFFGEAAQRRAANPNLNPISQLQDSWKSLQELRKFINPDKPGEESRKTVFCTECGIQYTDADEESCRKCGVLRLK